MEKPGESVYRLALLKVKMAASLHYLQVARQLAAEGKKAEAEAEYKKAITYDPLNRAILQEALALGGEAPKEAAKKEKIEPPVRLKAVSEKVKLKFTPEANLRSIFEALGKYAGVNILFDEQFRDVPFATDLTDMDFEQALANVCLATKNFFRVIDERTVIIAPDQPLKRLQYEQSAIKTFYLSNINAQDILGSLAQMISTQMRAPKIIVDKNLNTVTIRDTPQIIELAAKLIQTWDKPKAEVIIDMEIMEVSRLKLRQLGLSFDQNIIGFRYGGTDSASSTTGWYNLKGINLSDASNYFLSFPVAFIQFLESDADTKIIAQPRLRGVGDEEIRSLVGQKVPIPQTTFSPIAAGGVSQQPIVNYTYQDVGIEIKITPKIHFEKEITLTLDLKITSIGGKGVADIPIITTREIKNVIRLRDGETNLLAGLLKDEERKSIKGISGIKNIPVLGRLFSSEDTTIEQTDVILTITPYIIRQVPVTAEDTKPLWIELEGISTGDRAMRGMTEEEMIEEAMALEEEEAAAEEEAEPAQNQIFLNPSNLELPQNREFRISVNMRSEQEVGNMSLNLAFNPRSMKLKEVIAGGMIRQLGENVPFLKNIDNSSGICTIGFSSPQPGRGIRGAGSLATLIFESVGPGEGIISVSGQNATSSRGQPVNFETSQARVFVR
jgi:general secretion pathway protein D